MTCSGSARRRRNLDAVEAIGLRALAADWWAPAFPLAGADLLALGVPEGPAVGRIMALVRAAWEESDFALDRDACLALARDLARDLTP